MKVTIIQKDGPQLIVDTRYDEQISTMLSKLNDFRGPDMQIKIVFDRHGKPIPNNMLIRGALTLWTYPPSKLLNSQTDQYK